MSDPLELAIPAILNPALTLFEVALFGFLSCSCSIRRGGWCSCSSSNGLTRARLRAGARESQRAHGFQFCETRTAQLQNSRLGLRWDSLRESMFTCDSFAPRGTLPPSQRVGLLKYSLPLPARSTPQTTRVAAPAGLPPSDDKQAPTRYYNHRDTPPIAAPRAKVPPESTALLSRSAESDRSSDDHH